MPNGYDEPKVLSRLSALAGMFERRHGHWPSYLKLGRHVREELRRHLGPLAYGRLLDRLAALPEDESPTSHQILVADETGHAMEYGAVDLPFDPERVRLWLDLEAAVGHPSLSVDPEQTHLEWDVSTDHGLLDDDVRHARESLADCARAGAWDQVLGQLHERPGWVNAARPGGSSGFTPLHQAAYLGAPPGVIRALLDAGAWRLLRTAQGELPIDIARRRGHEHLANILLPRPSASLNSGDVTLMEVYFHAVIRARAAEPVERHRLRLPALEPLQEIPMKGVWMPVPGMYGGFLYWLLRGTPEPTLVTASWSRVIKGSGQKHQITRYGVRLVEEGFV